MVASLFLPHASRGHSPDPNQCSWTYELGKLLWCAIVFKWALTISSQWNHFSNSCAGCKHFRFKPDVQRQYMGSGSLALSCHFSLLYMEAGQPIQSGQCSNSIEYRWNLCVYPNMLLATKLVAATSRDWPETEKAWLESPRAWPEYKRQDGVSMSLD